MKWFEKTEEGRRAYVELKEKFFSNASPTLPPPDAILENKTLTDFQTGQEIKNVNANDLELIALKEGLINEMKDLTIDPLKRVEMQKVIQEIDKKIISSPGSKLNIQLGEGALESEKLFGESQPVPIKEDVKDITEEITQDLKAANQATPKDVEIDTLIKYGPLYSGPTQKGEEKIAKEIIKNNPDLKNADVKEVVEIIREGGNLNRDFEDQARPPVISAERIKTNEQILEKYGPTKKKRRNLMREILQDPNTFGHLYIVNKDRTELLNRNTNKPMTANKKGFYNLYDKDGKKVKVQKELFGIV